MELFLILLAIAGIGLLIAKLCDTAGEAQLGKEGWANFQKAVHEEEEKKKYNDYMFSCPMCGSKKVRRIGTVNRAASVAVTGLASGKIGKQYECDNCHHKW